MQERALLQSFRHKRIKEAKEDTDTAAADTDKLFTTDFETYYSRIINYTA